MKRKRPLWDDWARRELVADPETYVAAQLDFQRGKRNAKRGLDLLERIEFEALRREADWRRVKAGFAAARKALRDKAQARAYKMHRAALDRKVDMALLASRGDIQVALTLVRSDMGYLP